MSKITVGQIDLNIQTILNPLLIKPRIIGIMLIAIPILLVTSESQNALASVPRQDADIVVDEAAEAGNDRMTAGRNQTTNGNMTGVEFLGIQNAQSGSISEINATAYTLELTNVSDSTILFSNRPNRIVTTITISDFVGNWSTGPDSFAADAPNDALIVENTQTGELDTVIIELFNPIYDANTNTLTYTIMAEYGTTINLPSEFGQSILLIDSSGQPGPVT